MSSSATATPLDKAIEQAFIARPSSGISILAGGSRVVAQLTKKTPIGVLMQQLPEFLARRHPAR